MAVAQSAGTRADDFALIRAAQQGDQVAFEQLVRAHDQSVLKLAMNLLRSNEDSADVYQEAFLRRAPLTKPAKRNRTRTIHAAKLPRSPTG